MGEVQVQPDTIEMIAAQTRGESVPLKKGDVFSVAEIAGITAAKRTWDLIPLCHPLPLEHIDVDISADSVASRIQIAATVKTFARTGVEMEALTAVGVAALTIYDMCKSVDKSMQIGNIRVTRKAGGASGDFTGSD